MALKEIYKEEYLSEIENTIAVYCNKKGDNVFDSIAVNGRTVSYQKRLLVGMVLNFC